MYRHIVAIVILLSLMLLAVNGAAQEALTPVRADTTLANMHFAEAEKLAKEAKYDSANFYFEKASVIYEKVGYWDKYVSCLNKTAHSYIKKMALEAATKYVDQALNTALNRLGEQDPEVAASYNNIGEIHRLRGDYDQAIEFHNKTLSIRRATLGENHPEVAHSYSSTKRCRFSWRRLEKIIAI